MKKIAINSAYDNMSKTYKNSPLPISFYYQIIRLKAMYFKDKNKKKRKLPEDSNIKKWFYYNKKVVFFSFKYGLVRDLFYSTWINPFKKTKSTYKELE